MFQEIIVFLIVGLAVAYLARRFWGIFTTGKSCGGCGSACGGKVQQPQTLVQLQINLKDKMPR